MQRYTKIYRDIQRYAEIYRDRIEISVYFKDPGLNGITHSWATTYDWGFRDIFFKQNLNTIRTSPSASQPQPAKPQASQPQASPQPFVSCRLQTCGQLQVTDFGAWNFQTWWVLPTLEHETFNLDESFSLWSVKLSPLRTVTDYYISTFKDNHRDAWEICVRKRAREVSISSAGPYYITILCFVLICFCFCAFFHSLYFILILTLIMYVLIYRASCIHS